MVGYKGWGRARSDVGRKWGRPTSFAAENEGAYRRGRIVDSDIMQGRQCRSYICCRVHGLRFLSIGHKAHFGDESPLFNSTKSHPSI